MVFFACDSCGASVKKNKVAKHKLNCRSCQSVACIDCGKDFWQDEYATHEKCISEEAKYSGKNYTPKLNANKGEKKQDEWMEALRSQSDVVSFSSNNVKQVLDKLLTNANVPTKEAKFKNFLMSSFPNCQGFVSTEIWNFVSKVKDELKKTNVKHLETKTMEDGPNGSERDKRKNDTDCNAGAVAITENESLSKKEKKKRKREEKELQASCIAEARDKGLAVEEEEGSSMAKKKDKNKKKLVEEELNTTVVSSQEGNGSNEKEMHVSDDANGSLSKKHRRSKKRKHADKENVDESNATADSSVAPEEEKKSSKGREKKKQKLEQANVANDGTNENTGKRNGLVVERSDSVPKKRKHSDMENVGEINVAADTTVTQSENGTKRKKRRKKKTHKLVVEEVIGVAGHEVKDEERSLEKEGKKQKEKKTPEVPSECVVVNETQEKKKKNRRGSKKKGSGKSEAGQVVTEVENVESGKV